MSGLSGNLALPLCSGATVAVMPRFQPEDFLQTVAKYKIRSLLLVPPLVLFLAKHPMVDEYDLSHLETITAGAAPLSKEVSEAVKNRLSRKTKKDIIVLQAFGMTESTLMTHFQTPELVKPGGIGVLVPNTQSKVINPETGEVLGPNREGEMCIRGPMIMKGYHNNAEATAKTVDEEGWLHTGDAAYYDEVGHFFIVDRLKELIKYKAFQVAPAELEGLLCKHPHVADAAVVGVPDEEAGELPKAYVIRKSNEVSEAELMEYVAQHVSPQKRLRGGVEFVSEIPKNPSGKILRRALKEKAKLSSKL